jgi:plastocyanin
MESLRFSQCRGISTTIAVVAIIVIIVVVAGGVLVLSQHGSTTTSISSTSSVSSSSASSASTSSTSAVSSSTSSSASSSTSSSSTAMSSTSHYSGQLLVTFADPNTLLGSSNVNVSYMTSVNALGNVPSSVSLTPITSNGISVSFSPDNVSTSSQTSIQTLVSVANGTKLGIYSLQTNATGGGGSFNVPVTINVVQYLVLFAPAVTPTNLTVPMGSTVTWLRTNGLIGEHGANGSQNVVFNNNMASSPQLLQWSSWAYTFNQTGTFPYTSTYEGETGEIVVS